MEKSLQEVLRENKEREQQRKREEIKRLKREQKKETILAIVIGSFIFIATAMLLSKMNNDFVSDCKKAGHTQSYCERGL